MFSRSKNSIKLFSMCDANGSGSHKFAMAANELEYLNLILYTTVLLPQDKEPSARSELAVIQPLWPSVDLLIFRKSVKNS